MRIVINTCFGGFGLSSIACDEIVRRGGPEDIWEISRTDPILIAMIEEDSELYSGNFAKLKVVEIPDDVEWEISDYDGIEHIAEKHRTWC